MSDNPIDSATDDGLAACPFCGCTATARIVWASELHDEDDGPYPHTDMVQVCCSMESGGPGGCGSSGGFRNTEAEAIEVWNLRSDTLFAASRAEVERLRAALADVVDADWAYLGKDADTGNPASLYSRVRRGRAALSNKTTKG